MDESQKPIMLPHHEQQALCTTRLAYRQGRKFTAVKVYSITKESNHLLVFGVPSLNLRQETKSLFIKFGKLLKFCVSSHAAEPFTETYHAQYEKIQSAKIAKRKLDTKNFYGGVLHVCYAPELESVGETRQKLIQRQRDVVFRLRNLEKEAITEKQSVITPEHKAHKEQKKQSIKMNMGVENTIRMGTAVGKKRKVNKKVKITEEKVFKPCFIPNSKEITDKDDKTGPSHEDLELNVTQTRPSEDIEVVDCTSVEAAVVTNINEHLNYNKFGNETIRKVQMKPENRIQFFINKKS